MLFCQRVKPCSAQTVVERSTRVLEVVTSSIPKFGELWKKLQKQSAVSVFSFGGKHFACFQVGVKEARPRRGRSEVYLSGIYHTVQNYTVLELTPQGR